MLFVLSYLLCKSRMLWAAWATLEEFSISRGPAELNATYKDLIQLKILKNGKPLGIFRQDQVVNLLLNLNIFTKFDTPVNAYPYPTVSGIMPEKWGNTIKMNLLLIIVLETFFTEKSVRSISNVLIIDFVDKNVDDICYVHTPPYYITAYNASWHVNWEILFLIHYIGWRQYRQYLRTFLFLRSIYFTTFNDFHFSFGNRMVFTTTLNEYSIHKEKVVDNEIKQD